MSHIPVLLNEAIQFLSSSKGEIFVDATFGGGGHSSEILNRLHPKTLFSFDSDPSVFASHRQNDLVPVYSNYAYISNFVQYLRIEKVGGILADLGVSSIHFDKQYRGFSYKSNGNLDMRMNTNQILTAKTVVNQYSESRLKNIFSNYGEIRDASTFVEKIVKFRKNKSIDTTQVFVDVLGRHLNFRILSRLFQAIRIEVNKELHNLHVLLKSVPNMLQTEGVFVVISYHSLEDRMVKKFFAPLVKKNIFVPLSKSPLTPLPTELKLNHRSRSAKLRGYKKIT